MSNYAEMADEFFQAYNDCDLDAVEKRLSPTLDFAHNNRGFATRSRDELMGVLRQFVDAIMPDRRFSAPSSVIVSGNTVVRLSLWSGKAQHDIPGFGKAGELIELNLCSVLRFDDSGTIVEWKDYG